MDGDLDLPGGLVDGPRLALGSVAVLLLVAWLASRRRTTVLAPVARGVDRLAETLLAFERWVVDSLGGATVTLVVAAAWTADVVDAGAFGAPADAAARGVVRVARAARPHMGGSFSRVFWSVVALFGVACVGHALWPAR
jgi:hypothetical protein